MGRKARCDVLVVGLGPAGAAAALELARAGAKVVAIDKAGPNRGSSEAVLGAKPCAGGLTRWAWSLVEGIDLAADPQVKIFHHLGVCTRLGRTWLRDEEPLLATVDRRAWATATVELLEGEGVDVRLETRFLSFDDEGATTNRGRIPCDRIVGADGAASRVRRALGLPSAADTVGWQLRVEAREPRSRFERPWVWFSPKELGVGYGWVFPAAKELRIGLGGPKVCAVPWKKELYRFANKLGLEAAETNPECASIGCNYQGHRFGRVFLAGDAAGLASPLTGEGIRQALLSGKEIAAEILKDGHRSQIIPSLGRRHRRTLATLAPSPIHVPLYALAPWILKVPAVRRETKRRYIL